METPLVTIIVTLYNREQTVGRTIKSILAQTYTTLDILVVDDGSTDDSAAVLASFGDRIHVSRKPNGGMVSAMNHGFRLSRHSV